MKYSRTMLVGCLAIFLAGCVLRSTPKTAKLTPPPPKPVVAPPPEPPKLLSTPQTNVELPAPQPLNPEALLTLPPRPEPVPEPTVLRRPRRAPTVVSNPVPKPEASPTPPEQAEERPAIQEIIPAEEQTRLKDSVERRKAEVNKILNSFNSRHPATPQQKNKIRYVRSFLDVAIDAANHGDLKQADAMAEKAEVLARELQSGK